MGHSQDLKKKKTPLERTYYNIYTHVRRTYIKSIRLYHLKSKLKSRNCMMLISGAETV
jgi:hypothetical protein